MQNVLPHFFRVLAVLLLAAQVTACSSAARFETAEGPLAGKNAARVAQSLLGSPYKYGGATPKGFDCSGLVQYSYKKAGVRVPRTSHAQYKDSRAIDRSKARIGDLVFFSTNRKISHVGIYIGDDKFVHAPSSGRHVEVGDLNWPYYRDNLVRVGRPN